MNDKIKNLLRNYGKMLGVYFIFFMLLGMLSAAFPELDFERYKQLEMDLLLEGHPWKFVFMAVLFAPILEEGMFRSIIKPTRNNLSFFLCCWIVFFLSEFIPTDVYWPLKLTVVILISLLLFLFFREFLPDNFQKKTCQFLTKHYLPVWLITSVVFGLVHIFNYVDTFQINTMLILLIIPRIIAGYFFGKIKIENNNLLWSMGMHAMNNAAVVIFLIPRFL
ncbi:CPBP family intramembrane metalloprotease [Gillisia sp. M10.2A]|uniref:CPBP family intramembrane metalloprotease n=1 Tax=Gillisia lutea TaxID=2909668 RepID=A0ABS9EIG0_9FLAO|nr:CPBP family intramembrane glutamic endopeptidase [Gillisia lutea]MCF4102611.1 CPBP family intramembrane metalloprotease [Gillisia lutea]